MEKSTIAKLLQGTGVKYWTKVQNHRNKGWKGPLLYVVHPPNQTRTAVDMGQPWLCLAWF